MNKINFKVGVIVLLIFASFFLGGCVTSWRDPDALGIPKLSEIKARESTFPAISAEEAKKRIIEEGYSSWKNPEGVRYREPRLMGFGWAMFIKQSPTYGYLYKITLNAQNGYGAYTGYKDYIYLVTAYGAQQVQGYSNVNDPHAYPYGTTGYFYGGFIMGEPMFTYTGSQNRYSYSQFE
jgi:hypothetical protein